MKFDVIDPRAAADAVFDAGTRREDVAAALAALAGREAEFLSRLATRAALRPSEDTGQNAGADNAVPDTLLVYAEAKYEGEKVSATLDARPKDLSRMQTWMAAKPAFGNDTAFVLKLFGRHVSEPTPRFMRYAADALGVAIRSVREHFADGMPRGLVGAEFKSSEKPQVDRVERFADAVQASKVPEELRSRWLVE